MVSFVLFFALLCTILVIPSFAESGATVYVCDTGSDNNTGLSADAALKTLDAAVNKLNSTGGTIIICGNLTLTDKQSYIEVSAGHNVVVSGQNYNGKITVNQTTDNTTNALIHCLSPVEFNCITFDYIGNGTLELYAGPSLTIGNGVVTKANGVDLTSNSVVIRGGVRTAGYNTSVISVSSGTWGYISGGNNKKVVTNSYLNIDGTTQILSFVQAGGTNQKVSNSIITISGISVPSVFTGGYGSAQTGSCELSIQDADVGAIYGVRSAADGASINRNVSIDIEESFVPVIDYSSVAPAGQVSLNVEDGGIHQLDNMFDGIDNVSIEGNTTLYIHNFTRPSSLFYVGSGSRIILDENLNTLLPTYTGNGSVQIAAMPITGFGNNYQGTLLLKHNRAATVCDGRNRSAQGIAGYENYFVVLYNGGTAAIYDMDSTTPKVPVGVVDLESININNPDSRYTNHCNSAVFSNEKWDPNDPLPLLYVTTGHTYEADVNGYIARCSVERFTYSVSSGWNTETVQTIVFNDNDYCSDTFVPENRLQYDYTANAFVYPDRPELGFYNVNNYERIGWGWPTWLVDSAPTNETEGYIYTFRSRFQSTIAGEAEDQARYGISDYETDNAFIITKFALPELPASESDFGRVITLTPMDIEDQFTTEFSLYYTQGGTMYQNNIYFMCGHGEQLHGFKNGLNVFNVKDKRIISKVDLSSSTLANEEMQGALVYNGKIVVNTNNFNLYLLDYIESDWLTYQPATLTEDGIEVIIDCASGEIRDSRVIPHN